MSTSGLAAALIDEGGTVARCLVEPAADTPSASLPARLTGSGPRAAGHEGEYELLMEMIFEGALLHYGAPRVLHVEDPDLALLLGDRLYALGLSRLAGLGDLAAVTELADTISLVAQASAADDAELASAVWEAGAVAIGWGGNPAHEQAKALARTEHPGAAEALRAAASRTRA